MPKPDEIKTYKDLAKLNVPRLRELAAADTQMAATTVAEKPELLAALCAAYSIEPPKVHKPTAVQLLKAKVRGVKKERDAQLAVAPKERDQKQLDGARRKIKALKRQMRRLTGAAAH
jgi:hypothetical protein